MKGSLLRIIVFDLPFILPGGLVPESFLLESLPAIVLSLLSRIPRSYLRRNEGQDTLKEFWPARPGKLEYFFCPQFPVIKVNILKTIISYRG